MSEKEEKKRRRLLKYTLTSFLFHLCLFQDYMGGEGPPSPLKLKMDLVAALCSQTQVITNL